MQTLPARKKVPLLRVRSRLEPLTSLSAARPYILATGGVRSSSGCGDVRTSGCPGKLSSPPKPPQSPPPAVQALGRGSRLLAGSGAPMVGAADREAGPAAAAC